MPEEFAKKQTSGKRRKTSKTGPPKPPYGDNPPSTPYSLLELVGYMMNDHKFAEFIHDQLKEANTYDITPADDLLKKYYKPTPNDLTTIHVPPGEARCTDHHKLIAVVAYQTSQGPRRRR